MCLIYSITILFLYFTPSPNIYILGEGFYIDGGNLMKKVAILLDGAFVQKRLKNTLKLQHNPEAEVIYDFSLNLIDKNQEEIFRIFFYHGEPFRRTVEKPISRDKFDFNSSPLVDYSERLFRELGQKNYIAIRKGETVFRGWKLKDATIERLKSEPKDNFSPLRDDDFSPELDQKGVDIRIGLDVAWLASKHIVDRIILVTGDSDFVPTMKFARKEGIQVVLVRVGGGNIKDSLLEHSDLVRGVYFKDGKWELSDYFTAERENVHSFH